MSTNTTPKQPIMNKSSRGMSKNGYDTKLHGAFVEQSAGAGDNLPGLSCKQINQQIVAASQSTSAQPILTVIAQNLEHMNIVNLSTAAHRLARIASSSNGAQLAKVRQHPILAKLFQAIFEKFQDSVAAGSSQSQAMSNIAWSLATLNFTGNPALVHSLAQLTVDNLREFKPYELTTVTWAFAKLVSSAGQHELRWCPDHFFSVIAEYVLANIGEYCFRCLSTFAWAFATVRFRNAILFRTIAQQMPTVIGGEKTTSQQIADTVWAFATMGFHDVHLFAVLAEDALKHMRKAKPQEISDMLWAFAESNVWHEKFFLRAGEVARRSALPPQSLIVIISSFARIQPHHWGTRTTVLGLVPACTKQMMNFSPEELSLAALAIAKVFGHREEITQPIEVVEFFAAATSLSTVQRIQVFSDQSLVDFATALSMLRWNCDGDGCIEAIRAEAMQRINRLEPMMLIVFLRSFATMPDTCSSSVALFASKLLQDFEQLDSRAMQILSHSIAQICALSTNGEHFSLTELREHLAKLAYGQQAVQAEMDTCADGCDLISLCDTLDGFESEPSSPTWLTTSMSRQLSDRQQSDDALQDDDSIPTKSENLTTECRGFIVSVKNSFLHVNVETGVDDASEVSTNDGSSNSFPCSRSHRRASSLPPIRYAGVEQDIDREEA
eukprot:gnl/TRDRNA2_/TRDRNA2_177555_c1_seq39.p1 gnl/TRDRNA2_/TRDRNA2_177555_c1~~gnl/TRDRNA2_/TRDRNA2_177555_c1_seq39.p1  ORF type:complete len:667 (+),score=124.20 gnl/TRDRNA2_/TRDRNA2_177555_c1_seq39:82-2082(+)